MTAFVKVGLNHELCLGDLDLYYLKTAIDSQSKVETIWGVSLANDSELHTQNTDTQFDFYNALTDDNTWSGDKDTQLVGESVVFGDLLYFDWATKRWKKTDADAAATMPGLRIALESKGDGTYLKSNGATSAPSFNTPAGAGNMLKATYDTDEDGDIDVESGGTEKSVWTQYAIPYLSNTTVFGEIPIGTDNYALTVNGTTGYDWTHLQTYDAGLDSLATLTYVSDSFIKVTATDTYTVRTMAETKTDLGIDLSLYYLKTEIDTLSKLETLYTKDITDSDELDSALGLYYLKTAINTQGKVETIWGVTLATDAELTALTFIDLNDTPIGYSIGKYAKSTADGVIWDTPAGAGDMLKITYDVDTDGDIDVTAGGTEKSLWTLYAIPYMSGTTEFGEIPIGTAEYALTVNADATGYDFTLFDLSLYYLKTEINTQAKVEAIWSVSLVNDGDLDLYYLKTAIDSQSKVETIWGVSLANDSELHTQNT
ncbi:unnamed protein product, partial [marine sediment metagenome]